MYMWVNYYFLLMYFVVVEKRLDRNDFFSSGGKVFGTFESKEKYLTNLFCSILLNYYEYLI